MNRFSIHEDAETELSAATNYYESQSPGLGRAFIKEFERAVHQILTYPLSCQLVNRTVRILSGGTPCQAGSKRY